MYPLTPKILSNNPWLLPVLGFLLFVVLWLAFIAFAMHHKPQEVERHSLQADSLSPVSWMA
jgi:hypothetical protein